LERVYELRNEVPTLGASSETSLASPSEALVASFASLLSEACSSGISPSRFQLRHRRSAVLFSTPGVIPVLGAGPRRTSDSTRPMFQLRGSAHPMSGGPSSPHVSFSPQVEALRTQHSTQFATNVADWSVKHGYKRCQNKSNTSRAQDHVNCRHRRRPTGRSLRSLSH
jgi:hypothetical protein